MQNKQDFQDIQCHPNSSILISLECKLITHRLKCSEVHGNTAPFLSLTIFSQLWVCYFSKLAEKCCACSLFKPVSQPFFSKFGWKISKWLGKQTK